MPYFVLPVSPGRNLATLVETAVRVHLLRLRGYNAAELFVERHDRALSPPAVTNVADARVRASEDDGASDGV